jgi:hypothetical protein
MARKLYYELHIRPMFREIDREHMLRWVDLWSYDALAAINPKTGKPWRDFVLVRLTIPDTTLLMPPPTAGGPWPEEWIRVYTDWINNGAERLPMATATYSVLKKPTGYVLRAKGQKKAKDYAVWLERTPGRGNPPQFVLFEEPGALATGSLLIDLQEPFDAGEAKTVRVTDANGPQEVPIPA